MRQSSHREEKYRLTPIEAMRHLGSPWEGPSTLDLSLYSLIDDSAAMLIGERHFGNVNLSGIYDLTVDAAKGLILCDGVDLSGLTTASEPVIKCLAECRGDLELGGLLALSDEAAHCLSLHQGSLGLSGVTSLSDQAVSSLLKHRGDLELTGYLNSIVDLTPEGAERLASLPAATLCLPMVTELSEATAVAIARYSGYLDLPGLKCISEGALRRITRRSGGLGLGGLKTLPDSHVSHLRSCGGHVDLRGVESITETQARGLLGYRADYIAFGGLAFDTFVAAGAVHKTTTPVTEGNSLCTPEDPATSRRRP